MQDKPRRTKRKVDQKVGLSVVIPMYNEEENIATTIKEVKSSLKEIDEPWEVLLINDGSVDNTLQEAQKAARGSKNIRIISYDSNEGRGKALRTGFEEAQGDIVITIDSDLSYSADNIKSLYEVLKEEPEVGVVIGSPYMEGGKASQVPLFRLILSRLGNFIVGYALGGGIKTVTGILRGYRREVLSSLQLESKGKEIHLEILSKVLALGHKVKEIPAILEGRRKGKAKFNFRSTSYSHLIFSLAERPMAAFGLMGFFIIALGLITGFYIVFLWRTGNLNPSRPLMTLMVLLLLGGVQLLAFGLIGTQLASLRKELFRLQRDSLWLKSSLKENKEK